MEAVDGQLVADFLKQSQFGLPDRAVGRRNVAGKGIGGFPEPLWQRRAELRARFGRLVLAALLGGVAAAGSAVVLGWAVGLPDDVVLSLAPKSVTAPVAMGISG